MARRYRRYRSRRALKSVKYANETRQFAVNITWQNASTPQESITNAIVVPPTDIQGMRKVKNLTVQIQGQPNLTTVDLFNWALVYVPFGQNPGTLNTAVSTGQSFYEPNQNIIMSGLGSFANGLTRRTRLARNLNSGDRIVLLISVSRVSNLPTDVKFPLTFFLTGVVNYAITYN